ncbi:MAG: energy-coupling factor ABC transporter ATP-binding protein [Enterococcaceae bacterium]|nr:energy-coupling factor ABC transporter ATP-binding protein [Enterococcaceae bacterium]MCI1919072.1 energy-coupling factor ABC transporter ATP-binding protein [Enterococcaceae bacterium]
MGYIEVNDLVFEYPNGNRALDQINLEIDRGESVAIIGQNGAGKTTLVKMLNGLLKPSEGEVIIDHWNTKDYTTAKLAKKVGYVFQNPDDQIFHSNVYDEIAFAPKTAGIAEDLIEERVLEVARVSGLSEYLDDNPYDLPYSIRKFVAIASILALDSDVVVLDEPTAGQDKRGIQVIEKVINYLIDKNKSVITITHDMEFTVRNFDRIIVMAHKNKIAEGTPAEIFWKFDILADAKLMQPYTSRVAKEVGMEDKIINIEGFSNALKNEQLQIPESGEGK